MTTYDELVARGLIAQVTDEEEIRELVNEGKAVFYIGFDPTADSLHVGHFMALCLLKLKKMAGNMPIVLIGVCTAMIGDPSVKTDMRKMMTKETINHNVECFKKQMYLYWLLRLIFMESVPRRRLLLPVLIQSGSILVKKKFTILFQLVCVRTLLKDRFVI